MTSFQPTLTLESAFHARFIATLPKQGSRKQTWIALRMTLPNVRVGWLDLNFDNKEIL